MRRARAGVTLSEVLVATSLAAVGVLFVGFILVSGSRWSARVDGASHDAQTARLAVDLLRFELSQAGRGREGEGITLNLRDVPEGDVITVRYVSEEHHGDYRVRDAAFFVARDGAGRWNLYRQAEGQRKQPWLLGVRALTLREGRDGEGDDLLREELEASRLAAIAITVTLTNGAQATGWASTSRATVRDVPEGPDVRLAVAW